MSNPDISRLLLDYIVTARGICHENALILALIRLKMDYNEFDPAWSLQKWNTELNDNIDHINVKLNTLNYKIVKISHGMGKNAVTARNRQKFGLLEPKNMATDENNNSNQYENNEDDEDINNNIDNNNNNNNNSRSTTPNDGRAGIILPESNKFYVYVNMEPTDETKLATRFQEKEIAFVKWSIEQFVEHAMTIEPIQNNDIESNIIYKEINTLLNSLSHPIKDIANANIEDIQEDFKNRGGIKWKQFISFTARSTNLLRYEALGAAEIENLLLQLCELKWFYRDSNGRFGMDLRCIAELQDYLINEFELPTCQYCHQLTLQGVMCGGEACHASETEEENSIFQRRVWHLDCFQHYMLHVSQKCDKCPNSLLKNAIYII